MANHWPISDDQRRAKHRQAVRRSRERLAEQRGGDHAIPALEPGVPLHPLLGGGRRPMVQINVRPPGAINAAANAAAAMMALPLPPPPPRAANRGEAGDRIGIILSARGRAPL